MLQEVRGLVQRVDRLFLLNPIGENALALGTKVNAHGMHVVLVTIDFDCPVLE